MAAQDGPTGPTQVRTPEWLGVGGDGTKRRVVDCGRSPALVFGFHWPQRLPSLSQLRQNLAALVRDLNQMVIELSQRGERLVALDLEVAAGLTP